jgi:hypothetical protein
MEGFKAFFIAIGAQECKRLNIEGEGLEGGYDGLDYLRRLNLGKSLKLGNNVAVIAIIRLRLCCAATSVSAVRMLTWKDPKTGLEWQCQSPGEMNWYQAQKYAASLSLARRHDWRLPTLAQLESLLDRTRGRSDGRPVAREEVPIRDNLSYWSSTTFERHTKTAWIVMFDGAYVLSYYKSNLYYVRCVRG